jgi:hypothetical protein
MFRNVYSNAHHGGRQFFPKKSTLGEELRASGRNLSNAVCVTISDRRNGMCKGPVAGGNWHAQGTGRTTMGLLFFWTVWYVP